jgi:hypothetical protein
LFYKSYGLRPKDEEDFTAVLPVLGCPGTAAMASRGDDKGER